MSEKKGLGTLAWIAIGCVGLLVIAGIVFVVGGMFVAKKAGDFVEDLQDNPEAAAAMAAEMFVKANPELELVESDREAGTMTIRNKSDGETITINYEDLEKGKLSFETDEGDISVDVMGEDDDSLLTVTQGDEETFRVGAADADEIPGWIPMYEDATSEGIFAAQVGSGVSGSFRQTTDDGAKEVLAFYAEKLEDEGWQVQKTETSGPQGDGGHIIATTEDKNINLLVTSSDSGSQVVVNYNYKGD